MVRAEQVGATTEPAEQAQTYVKHYASPEAMWREWQALKACRGVGVQRVHAVDTDRQALMLEFDSSAMPLSEFDEADLALFVAVLPALVSVIQHCHARGWVHGDIKPSNIVYVPTTQTIRLIDFGASYRIGTSREALSEWQVTPMFATGQQVRGEGLVQTGDDWYALINIIDQVMPFAHDRLLLQALQSVRDGVAADIKQSERTTK